MNLTAATPSQIALHQAHKMRMQRMSGRPSPVARLTAPEAASVVLPMRVRREYETEKRLPASMPKVQRILTVVAREFDMPLNDLIGMKRTAEYCNARFVVVGLILEMTDMSFPAIGRRLGGRDHTTILHSARRADALFASEAFRNRVDQLKSEVLA